MRSRHLTRNAGVPVFQIRVPKALDPALTLSPIRVTLGGVPNSRARRIADMLGGLARVEFARIGCARMNDVSPQQARRQVEDRLALALPTLLGLGALEPGSLPGEIAPAVVDGVFDLLAEVGVKRAAGEAAATRLRPEVPIVAALADEGLARGLLGCATVAAAPKPDPVMAELAAIRELIGGRKGPHGPLFSAAAERFIAGRIDTYGDPAHPEIG